jgi:hypothetical protein
MNELPIRVRRVMDNLRSDPCLGQYVDSSHEIPAVYRAGGEIRLIILGQDPTIKNVQGRSKIQCTLNLDKSGRLRDYLAEVCRRVGFDLGKNVYATNLFKNFFTQQPTRIKEINIFPLALTFWLPLLREELAEFPDVPVLTLGNPLLAALVRDPTKGKVRNYWGYDPDWKKGKKGVFSYLAAQGNCLERNIFPFPHQPSLMKEFYRDRFNSYAAYTRQVIAEGQMV